MKYITLSDMMLDIRKNFHKAPHDVDFVIGIPRSGMICASVISEFLNVPLIDIDSFCRGVKPSGGGRLRLVNRENTKKVLVVDDTVYGGGSLRDAKIQLKPFNEEYAFIYLVTYLEGIGVDDTDIYLVDIRKYTNNFKDIVLYEWNLFHHYHSIMDKCIYDLDGVLCLDPPDEREKEDYIQYIKNATPLFTPTVRIGKILTYRLEKYREITMKWLEKHNIKYGSLIMFNGQSWEERDQSRKRPEQIKADFYKADADAHLFVESDDSQARKIFEISHKPVLCIATNTLYGGD